MIKNIKNLTAQFHGRMFEDFSQTMNMYEVGGRLANEVQRAGSLFWIDDNLRHVVVLPRDFHKLRMRFFNGSLVQDVFYVIVYNEEAFSKEF